jgi:DNA polymerase I-like protein with 3'-5' exonuclease and polymerase domains
MSNGLITANDIAARLKKHYGDKLVDPTKIPRIMFLVSEGERSAAGEIKRWIIEHKLLCTMLYSSGSIQYVRGKLAAGNYAMVVVSDPEIFKQLASGELARQDGQEDWQGSMLAARESDFHVPTLLLPYLVDRQGRQKRHTIPGEFTWRLERYLEKLISYRGEYQYRYLICSSADDYAVMRAETKSAAILVADIETDLQNQVTSVSFTCIDQAGQIGGTYVVDWDGKFKPAYDACKLALEDTPAIKCFHNGCFDMFMLMRHRIGVYNWLYDTEYMWHSWEAEAKKSLASLASYCLPDYIYWKAESKINMLEYNAKDTINTARCLLWLIEQMPAWAWVNYAPKVPTFLPTVMANLEGFNIDQERLAVATEKAMEIVAQQLTDMRMMLAWPEFNPASPKQVAHALYTVLGPVFGWTRSYTATAKKKATATNKMPSGTDETTLKQLALKHPFAARFVDMLLAWRENAKALSTYYTAYLYDGTRLYYSLQLDGTTTDRFSCSASSLRLVTGSGAKGQVRLKDIKNYGSQIQNAPPYFKTALCADPGYSIYNIDKSKSEAHCVATISGDKKFQEAIQDTTTDFYLLLAEWFFGIVTRDKSAPIRQVTKKINHATSYCMGWEVFLDQVGIVKLLEYMRLTGWKGSKEPKIFIESLLNGGFHATFPGIQAWWRRTTAELVKREGYLTTPDGATRHFFKYPKILNGLSPAAVAHQPQHLSVVTLNRNMAQVFYHVQIPSGFALRLKGQVHDSLVAQVRDDRPELALEAHRIMEIPYPTSLGMLAIPCDIEGPTKHWKEPKVKAVIAPIQE